MNPKEFELAACTAISRYFNDNADVTGVYLSPDDIYTVWSCKTLQNNKGLSPPLSKTACITKLPITAISRNSTLTVIKSLKTLQ